MSSIGIVTLSLNQARFLQQAIDSVQIDDPSRLNCVVVDAGTNNAAAETIERNRHRFTHVILAPGQGAADAVNQGFECVGGDILGYLDSGDRFLPGTLEYVLEMFESRPYMDVLLGGIRIIDQFDNVRFRKRTPDVFDVERFLYKSNYFWQQATFFRREVFQNVGGFNRTNRTCWDGELVMDLHLHGARVSYTDVLLCDFRVHPDSTLPKMAIGSRRFDDQNEEELERMRRKALALGYPGLSSFRVHLEHWRYKLDVVRRLGYVFHGGLTSRL